MTHLLWKGSSSLFMRQGDVDREDLADLVASHFGVEREMLSGNRNIGRVRVTVEKLESLCKGQGGRLNVARRATLDRKDLEFLRGMYFSPSVMAELTGGVKGRGWKGKIYRMSKLGLCSCDVREGSRAPMSWGVTQEGKRVVEMADKDTEFHLPRNYPNYRFCLARLDEREGNDA